MTVYPFPARRITSSGQADSASALAPSTFPDDIHDDFPEFDDTEEEIARYGSADRQYRWAHRTISSTVLAILTGVQIPVCQAFHHALFGLLEHVGDFDGLVATPNLLIGRDSAQIARASEWLTSHPQPDVSTLISRFDIDEPVAEVDRYIDRCIDQHSLGLATAADTNPSLTLGSIAHLQDRLIDEVLELLLSCQIDEIYRLTDAGVDVLGRMPESMLLAGGATVWHLPGGGPA